MLFHREGLLSFVYSPKWLHFERWVPVEEERHTISVRFAFLSDHAMHSAFEVAPCQILRQITNVADVSIWVTVHVHPFPLMLHLQPRLALLEQQSQKAKISVLVCPEAIFISGGRIVLR